MAKKPPKGAVVPDRIGFDREIGPVGCAKRTVRDENGGAIGGGSRVTLRHRIA